MTSKPGLLIAAANRDLCLGVASASARGLDVMDGVFIFVLLYALRRPYGEPIERALPRQCHASQQLGRENFRQK
jgi:hypothetical protein